MKSIFCVLIAAVFAWGESLEITISPMIDADTTLASSVVSVDAVALEVPVNTIELIELKIQDPVISASSISANTVPIDIIQMPSYAEFFAVNKDVLAEFLGMSGPDAILHMGNQNMAYVREWLNAYKSVQLPIQAPRLKPGLRMIAELRSPDNADANLRFYASCGYNSVLITINSDADSPDKLAYLAQLVRKHNMAPWLAWGGPDSYHLGLYRSLDNIRRQFRAVLPYCDGFIPSWRRTSVHLMAHDERYLNVLCQIAQSIKPDILILDEVMRRNGRNHINMINGSSATYISGYGFQAYKPKLTADMFFHEYLTTRPCLALVVGHSAHYASRRDHHLSWNEAFLEKTDLEKQFLDAGFVGTITLHGDGYDNGLSLQSTDDIGLFPIQ